MTATRVMPGWEPNPLGPADGQADWQRASPEPIPGPSPASPDGPQARPAEPRGRKGWVFLACVSVVTARRWAIGPPRCPPEPHILGQRHLPAGTCH